MRQRNWIIIAFIIIVVLLIAVVYLVFELRMQALRDKYNQQAPLSVLNIHHKRNYHY